ncbi:MAG TPA: ABC-2 family transporter protein [Thermomicrobiales bacterium]|nr:ABC-2 family transporter protein [Thermomicrobiales bacterium]
MHAVSVVRTYLKLGALNALQYRANLLFDLIGVAGYLASFLLTLGLIFRQTDSLNGWSADELVALVGIQILVGGFIGLVIRPSMQLLMENIRLGSLDFMLTKPADSQLLASVQQVNFGSIAQVAIGLAVIGTALVRLGATIGPRDALAFVVLIFCSLVIVTCFLTLLSTLSFWFVRLDNILVIFQSAFDEAGRWPIGIYPGWLRISLTFLIPIAFAVTVPAESLTGRLTVWAVVGTVALAAGFIVVTRWFWRVGLRRYTGASA